MFSQCPECQARFRVTAAQLRAAHGTVRCGRCGSAFDALERLSDAPPGDADRSSRMPTTESLAEPSSAAAVAADAEFHFTAEDLEKVFIDVREWQRRSGTQQDTGTPEAAAAAEDLPVVVVESSALVEDITLEGERISLDNVSDLEIPAMLRADREYQEPEYDLDSTDRLRILTDVPDSAYVDEEEPGEVVAEPVQLAEMEQQPDAPAEEPESPEVQAEAAPVVAEREEPATLDSLRWRRSEPDEEIVPAPAPMPPVEAPRRHGIALGLGSLLLALLLFAQLVHHFRQDLARHPQVGPPLREVYARLGLPLDPNWDLQAFELLQWGSRETETPGELRVRASLSNRAGFAQPHPLLRLELEDRYGAPVAVREFEPEEYLKDSSTAGRMLEAGSTAEAELLIANPGMDAVGYRLDICVRESPTQLRCAEGAG
jgi:predicted Zn finger-like uncharacterized protein